MNILYEDNHLIAVLKPAGVLVQAGDDRRGGSGTREAIAKNKPLIDLLKEFIKKRDKKPGNVFLGLIHRLDRNVAGIILFAKTSKGASRLSEQFREHTVRKIYHAWVHGFIEPTSGAGKHVKLRNFLVVNENNNKTEVFDKEVKDSVLAELSYEVVEADRKNKKSLLKVELMTGRHHQIRAQLSHSGHAIVGDKKYGSSVDYPDQHIDLFATELHFATTTGEDRKIVKIPAPGKDGILIQGASDIDLNKDENSGPKIIDGRVARSELKIKLIKRVKNIIKKKGATPCLAIIQVGDRPDSTVFISAKKKFATEIGAKEIHVQFDENAKKEEILAKIVELNTDKDVHGIIVQLPLPIHLNCDEIINKIDPCKDVDGLTSSNATILPATARGIRELLEFYKIDLQKKKVVVIGRSKLVGKPIARMCEVSGAIVTVCHSETSKSDFVKALREADVIMSATGKTGLVRADLVHKGQIVIDVGISRVDEKLVGDVDFSAVCAVIGPTGAITPVPGGVGQMTVLSLFENLVDACYNQVTKI